MDFVALRLVFEGDGVVIESALKVALFVGVVGLFEGFGCEGASVGIFGSVCLSVLDVPQRLNAHPLKQKVRKPSLLRSIFLWCVSHHNGNFI